MDSKSSEISVITAQPAPQPSLVDSKSSEGSLVINQPSPLDSESSWESLVAAHARIKGLESEVALGRKQNFQQVIDLKKAQKSISDLSLELETSQIKAQDHISELSLKLETSQAKAQTCISDLSLKLKISQTESQHCISDLCSKLKSSQAKAQGLYKELCHACQCLESHRQTLQDQINILHLASTNRSHDLEGATASATCAIESLLKIEKENKHLHSELSLCLERTHASFVASHKKLTALSQDLRKAQQQNLRLKKCADFVVSKTEQSMKKAKQKALNEMSTHHLLHKGVYTEDTLNLIHLLVKAGCSKEYVSDVIFAVLKSAGITTIRTISRRTVSPVLIEGYIAAQVQLGFEMLDGESMIFSADGTSHKNINFNSRHMNLKTEDYATGDGSRNQVTRSFGIMASVDGSSEELMKDWDSLLKVIADLFNQSSTLR